MIIGITGHRDRLADTDNLRQMLTGATLVVHGGAAGFDQQAAAIAQEMGIATRAILPDYSEHGRAAPLIRNRQIVEQCNQIIACYDGRKSGGTYYTINYAHKRHIPVTIVQAR